MRGILFWLAWSIALLNYVRFGTASWTVFKKGPASRQLSLFKATWIASICSFLLLQYLYPANDPRLLAGLVLFAVSSALFELTAKTVRQRPLTTCFTESRPAFVYQTGPYRYVRHPFYSAYLLTYFASALCIDTPAGVAVAALMLAVYYGAARQEESNFSKGDLSQAYAQYRSATGMFLPRGKF